MKMILSAASESLKNVPQTGQNFKKFLRQNNKKIDSLFERFLIIWQAYK